MVLFVIQKMLADISIHSAKVSMSTEKLAVHLKGTVIEENQVIAKGNGLLTELSSLRVLVTEQVETLEASVAQLEHYQQVGQKSYLAKKKVSDCQSDNHMSLASIGNPKAKKPHLTSRAATSYRF